AAGRRRRRGAQHAQRPSRLAAQLARARPVQLHQSRPAPPRHRRRCRRRAAAAPDRQRELPQLRPPVLAGGAAQPAAVERRHRRRPLARRPVPAVHESERRAQRLVRRAASRQGAARALRRCGGGDAIFRARQPGADLLMRFLALLILSIAPLAQGAETGCLSCHTATDRATMHESPAVILGCTDCHGGNPMVRKPEAAEAGSPGYLEAVKEAHVQPRDPRAWGWPAAANPERSYTLLNRESPEYVRFVNPGDYRVARETCGKCHLPIVQAAERSLMATGAMLWNGAAYNNGILSDKRGVLGEAYTRSGQPAMVQSGITQLYPLPAWETVPPADVFRVFERGGRVIGSQFPEVGLPNAAGRLQTLDEPGRPDFRQSNRGPGTGARIAVPLINLTKTRLNDPLMWFMGTNDQPGDYRSSGCSACHVV